MDMKLEVVVVPVADIDRAKGFYASLGWRLDADFPGEGGFRVVQFTPPGSQCYVQFGAHITGAPPGSAHGLYLIVLDIEAARGDIGGDHQICEITGLRRTLPNVLKHGLSGDGDKGFTGKAGGCVPGGDNA